MELSPAGVAVLLFGRTTTGVARVIGDAILDDTSLLAVDGCLIGSSNPLTEALEEMAVSMVAGPCMGVWSDRVGRKPLLVGASALAATCWGWLAARRRGGTPLPIHTRAMCRLLLSVARQGWQIGFGAVMSDLELDPKTEQAVEVVTTLAQSMVEIALQARQLR